MESVHGVDVSWMSKHTSHSSNAKDNNSRPHTSRASTTPIPEKNHSIAHNGNGHPEIEHERTPPKAIPTRPNYSRSASSEKTVTLNGSLPRPSSVSPNTSRRNSWLSSISSKFGAHNAQVPPSTPPASTTPPSTDPPVPTGPQAPKNAILPHVQKVVGDAPYTPAPPRTGQPSFLQSALRRLSSSGGQLAPQVKGVHHGICERKVLNVDHNRERCRISDLDQSKLRRVAFCVDVEIASGPRYHDEDYEEEKRKEKKEKKRMEKGEGLALKQPEAIKEQKEADGVVKATGEQLPTPGKEVFEATTSEVAEEAAGEKDNTKKKEKKKRSEEERKARKEKKRKLAEANGTVPVELVRDGDSSGTNTPNGTGTPRTQASPTTDPVRIYRRCCQLRETPILKKITEQLTALSTRTSSTGVVCKLDLTGYWLQLPDLVTLGDYLAVVPVKELVMENCGLSDEGVRVILAGLLAAKCPDWERRNARKGKWGEVPQGGVVERVVFKNNTKIGRDGWRYISTFLTMCRSLKSIDLSKVPFPQPVTPPHTPPAHGPNHLTRTNTSNSTAETACVLGRAIGERLGGREFELLNMAECGLTTEQLGSLIDGVIKSGLRRLGIAGNSITSEGMHHVARFIREGKCEGLDLGGNDLKDQLGVIANALDDNNQLYALSLADCNLTPDSLWALFPALAKLKNFRFIDLSQNHGLFDSEPSALSLLRRYLPKLPTLKRIHLTDVSMTSEQAIALAEILPESPNLAHVNIMENPGLAVLADAKDEANQEEACALYASLMAAVRVSKTIICIDIEVPSPESSEIVKALAKQVVAYCLWNMERGPVAEISEAAASISDPHGGEKEVAVPDVLLHLVGHVEGFHENHDDDEPAPDDDYVIGGTGVVKALGICLRNRGNDSRRPSADRTFSGYSQGGRGSETPTTPVSGGKAKDMSKNLLGSARKIRARLQPALVKEARSADRNNYHRLLFLDQTLEGMIKRFEDEFPETRLPTAITSPPLPDMSQASPSESLELSIGGDGQGSFSDTEPTPFEAPMSDAEEDDHIRPMLSRHNSDVSLASRALSQEEGRMHRFGQQFRRDILKPDLEDHEHGTTGREEQPRHLQLLRAMVDGLGGEEIKNKMNSQGHEAVMEELNNEASLLRRQLMEQDPEGWEKFRESQEVAMRNSRLAGLERNVSAIE
ncbi:probable GIP3 Glc7-interacting protein whose overexpression relocalizes Glc7p from the nucleus [Phialocephala subalpina]|uniref:Probable GIP3 Glc7-interacting protein whose overexpression relocalizes Glc7p from the nucleus n=1 Tax=Phialocephala subalpina TaxID=576137 RepID=A0A1L7WKZ1_9HELO|nr:probable GIP3 Glc7-interacting protein whose overexpression relocalizes Glc7p from the nucleus [Phialocephala subalpina]